MQLYFWFARVASVGVEHAHCVQLGFVVSGM